MMRARTKRMPGEAIDGDPSEVMETLEISS